MRRYMLYTQSVRGGLVFFTLKTYRRGGAVKMKTKNKILTAFRIKPDLKKRLAKFAKRKRVTSTDVIEALIDRHCVSAKQEK